MSEHKTENQFQNNTKKNAAYLVQSYYDQNDELVSRDKFSICDGQLVDPYAKVRLSMILRRN